MDLIELKQAAERLLRTPDFQKQIAELGKDRIAWELWAVQRKGKFRELFKPDFDWRYPTELNDALSDSLPGVDRPLTEKDQQIEYDALYRRFAALLILRGVAVAPLETTNQVPSGETEISIALSKIRDKPRYTLIQYARKELIGLLGHEPSEREIVQWLMLGKCGYPLISSQPTKDNPELVLPDEDLNEEKLTESFKTLRRKLKKR